MSETLSTAPGEDRLLANRYELGELIGHGGMADVYRGHDPVLARTVAVKIFRSSDDAAARRRFADEGYALARLAHPGLVSVFDVGDVEQRPFLVMEFIDGMSLRSRLLDGTLGVARTARLGGLLADALAHAHHRGVVHRDVKPSNVMLDADDLPHLADFGIALLTDASHHTSANQVIGTPAYLAPEQLAGDDVGPAADVYALGLVLLECLTGEPEYASGTNLETALARLHRPPRIPENLPPELAALLTAMTSTDPADRPTAQNCAQRLLALPAQPASERIAPTRALAAVDPADRPTTHTRAHRLVAAVAPSASKRGAPRSRTRTLAASMAGIAAILVALVVLLHAYQPPPTQASSSTGHAQHGSSTSTAAPARPVGGDTRPVAGTLVANEHPALMPSATTTPSTVSATAPQSPSAPPSTTSSDTSAPPTSTSTSPTTTDPPTTSDAPAPAPIPTSSGQE